MANDRYVSAAERFGANGFYEAASVGAFNPTANPFGAFVLFYFLGETQDPGLSTPITPATPMFLWGNLDTAGQTGWSLEVDNNTPTNDGPRLVANIGTGGAIHKFVHPLTALAASGGGRGFVEQLILWEFWQDADVLCTAINGNIVTLEDNGDTHLAPLNIAPSANLARLGQSPEGNRPASTVGIVSAGFFNGLTTATPGSTVGSHFRNARASLQGSPFFENLPVFFDWTHRFEAYSLFAQYNQLVQKPNMAVVDPTKYPTPQATWPDVSLGSFTYNAPAVTPPVHANLTFNGNNVVPLLTSIKNPTWFVPSSSTAWIPNPGA